MPGFLSALFAAPGGDGSMATSSDHQAFDQATALDPSVHVHTGESGTEHHADGSVTTWSSDQDIGARLDVHELTHLGFDDGHASSSN